MNIKIYFRKSDGWLFERLWDIKTALNGTWRDVLEYLVTNKAFVKLPFVKPLMKTMPFVTVRKITHSKDIHIFRASTKKPWLDKYKGREVYSLNGSTGVVSGRLLVTREDDKIIIINASLATPPLNPGEYAKHARILLEALIHRLNRLCIEYGCKDIVVDKEAHPYLSFLEEINIKLAEPTVINKEP